MAALPLDFTLLTSANRKTVHLLGSWDNYSCQLPLSKDMSRRGGWKGTFVFQGASPTQGQRYWYYYIINGYEFSYDSARDFVIEPTTGRKLNTLDITHVKYVTVASRHSHRISSAEVPKGRSLSPSEIKSPKPTRPHATRYITTEQLAHRIVSQVVARSGVAQLDDSLNDNSVSESDSNDTSNVQSFSSCSSNSSTFRSFSSTKSCCTCERYGITRAGNRVKLDCGGSYCGYSDGSDCSSESEDEHRARATRRQGIVVYR